MAAILNLALNRAFGVRGADFGQGVVDDGQVESSQLSQTAIAARNEGFSLANVVGVEQSLVEMAFDDHRLELIVDNELRQHRVAADVPLARRVQRLRIDQAGHKSQIQIAIDQLFDVTA